MEKITKDIISSATTKFTQLGIRNVSIDDICSDVRISKKTFYKYFPQKEDLVLAVIKDVNEYHEQKFSKIYQNKNAIDALVEILKEIKKEENKRPHMFIHDLKKYYPDIFNKIKDEKRQRIKADFEQNLYKGIEEGYYREDMDVELVSLFHSIQIKNIFEEIQDIDPKIKEKRVLEFFIDLTVRLITNEKGFEYVQNKLVKDIN